MNTKKIKPIPKFSSYVEEAKFWDTHDFTEYADFSRAKWAKIETSQALAKEESLTLRMEKDLKKQISGLADIYGISTSSLARMWLIEKLLTISPRTQDFFDENKTLKVFEEVRKIRPQVSLSKFA